NYKADLILLDDAFQHRRVAAGLNILLTPYGNLYSKDIVLPTGNLREPKSGAKRADLIVVTKCPQNITQNEKDEIIKQLKPKVKQNLFFSWICYDEFIYSKGEKVKLTSLKGKDFTIVTGIANPKPFVSHLKSKLGNFKHLKYKDHHHFSETDLRALKQEKIIITTEKDYSRLRFDFDENQSGTELYYLPIRFEVDDKIEFNRILIEFAESY
ncbi:MAG: tetraacyldisaccharide 4'-kinase, partial [Bacteroidota bacterium]